LHPRNRKFCSETDSALQCECPDQLRKQISLERFFKIPEKVKVPEMTWSVLGF